MRLASLLHAVILALLASVHAPAADPLPEGVTLPLVVWDVNFNDNPLDAPPQPPSKKQLEAQNGMSEWEKLPIRQCTALQYLTETRKALVVKEAGGLKDTPLLFTYADNAQPHYGPMASFSVPPEIAKHGAVWRLSFDIAKGNVAISGGVHLWDVAGVEFFEDGTVRVGESEIARYAANKPIHFDCVIDAEAKTATFTADGDAARAVTVPWRYPKAENFGCLNLHGVLPGGHCEAPSSMIFDNIKLVMAKWK